MKRERDSAAATRDVAHDVAKKPCITHVLQERISQLEHIEAELKLRSELSELSELSETQDGEEGSEEDRSEALTLAAESMRATVERELSELHKLDYASLATPGSSRCTAATSSSDASVPSRRWS